MLLFFTKEDLIKLSLRNKLKKDTRNSPELAESKKTRPRSKSEGHSSKNEEHHLLCVGFDSLIRFFSSQAKKNRKRKYSW